MLTRVKGSVWNPDDNCMPSPCPTTPGQYVLNVTADGQPLWEQIKCGTVWPFYGSAEDIMDGWALCIGVGQLSDGRDVPDLTDRFVVSSGGVYDLGEIGGSLEKVVSSSGGHHSHSVVVHGHTLTIAEMPSHNHPAGTTVWREGSTVLVSGSGYNNRYSTGSVNIGYQGGNQPHSHPSDCYPDQGHVHGVQVNPPPYFALAFIIKL